jgi:D-arabinose 5-phosphate isomerase GutQ
MTNNPLDPTIPNILQELEVSYSLTPLLEELEIESTLTDTPLLGAISSIEQDRGQSRYQHLSDALLVAARIHSISGFVTQTMLRNESEIQMAKQFLVEWIQQKASVRILGAGRALLACAMPGNRIAHAGAQVSFMGGMVPLPNSYLGGGIIAASASGRTKPVLEAMEVAKANNPAIRIIGISHHQATAFKSLCDVFIGLHLPKDEYPNPLSALADTEEYMIAEILDGLVVLAGQYLGFNDEAWRCGHEDIGPTGPYAPYSIVARLNEK